MNASRLARCLALLLLFAFTALPLFQASPAEADGYVPWWLLRNHPPIFIDDDGEPIENITLYAMEDSRGHDVILTRNGVQTPLRAKDEDGGIFYYSISGGPDADKVFIVKHPFYKAPRYTKNLRHFSDIGNTVLLGLRGPVDFEKNESHDVEVTVRDPYLGSATVDVHIVVLDMPQNKEERLKNNPPYFTGYDPSQPHDGLARSINADAAVRDDVGDPVTAIDPDDDTINYNIVSHRFAGDIQDQYAQDFSIDSEGQIKVARSLSRADGDSYDVWIKISDTPDAGNHAIRWDVHHVHITVTAALSSSSAQGQQGVMEAPPAADSAAATKPVPALPKRLGRPGNVSAAAQGDGSILVSWDAPANAVADYYQIRRRADGGKYKVIVRKIADNGANDADSASGRIAYRDADGALNAGAAYTYGARAFHASIKRSKWTRGVSSE